MAFNEPTSCGAEEAQAALACFSVGSSSTPKGRMLSAILYIVQWP